MSKVYGIILNHRKADFREILAMGGTGSSQTASTSTQSGVGLSRRGGFDLDGLGRAETRPFEEAPFVRQSVGWGPSWRVGDMLLQWDGEIYNCAALRRSLGLPRDATDPQVVIEGWKRSGSAFLQRINGPFAMALLDLREGTWILARGRQGLRPLFWFESGEGIAFARDLPTLFRCPWVPRDVHWARIPEYLVFDHVAGGESLYRGVRELLPGQALSGTMGATSRTLNKLPYPASLPTHSLSEAHVVERTSNMLRAATARVAREVGSEACGLFLSGGVDSAILAEQLAAVRGGRMIHSLTVTCPGYRHDEAEGAKRVREELGLPGVEVVLTPDSFARGWWEAVEALRVPLTSTNQVPWWILCQTARANGWSAIFSGEGADGWFSGGLYDEEISAVAGLWKEDPDEAAHRLILCRTHRLNDPANVQHLLTIPLDVAPRRAIWGEVRAEASDRSIEEMAILYHVRTAGHRLLTRADLVAACHAIRLKLPYLEDGWLRWVRSISWAVRNSGGIRKSPLKALCAARWGKEFAHRRKIGFPFPIRTWIRDAPNPLLATWREMLLDTTTLGRDLYRKGALEQAVRQRLEGHLRPADWLLWSLINLELWLRQVEGDGWGTPELTPTALSPGVPSTAG